MALGRKAVFFSLGALLIIGMVFVAMTASGLTNPRSSSLQAEALKTELDVLQNSQFPVMLDAAATRTLQRMATKALESPYSNEEGVKNEFSACLMEGCYDQDAPLAASIERLEVLFENKSQSEIEVELIDARLSQLGPFTLYVEGTFEVTLRDNVTRSRINKNLTIGRQVSTKGLLDPYATTTLGEHRTIKQGTIGDGGPAVVWKHAIEGLYVPDTRSPSYLQRLTTNPGTSEHGVFTLARPGSRGSGDSYVDWQTSFDGDVIVINKPVDINWEGQYDKVQLSERYAYTYRLFDNG